MVCQEKNIILENFHGKVFQLTNNFFCFKNEFADELRAKNVSTTVLLTQDQSQDK